MSFARYLEWQADEEIPASQPERDSSGDEFDDASTLMLGYSPPFYALHSFFHPFPSMVLWGKNGNPMFQSV